MSKEEEEEEEKYTHVLAQLQRRDDFDINLHLKRYYL